MMKARHPFIFVLSLLLFAACGPDHSERLEKLEQLEEDLSELRERFDTIQKEKALELQHEVTESERLFQEHFKADSMDDETFRILDAYKRVRKSLGNYGHSAKLLEKELTRSGRQLENLRKDLEDGAHSEEKADTYIQDESESLDRVREAVKELESRTDAAFLHFEEKPAPLSKKVSLPDSLQWPGEGKQ